MSPEHVSRNYLGQSNQYAANRDVVALLLVLDQERYRRSPECAACLTRLTFRECLAHAIGRDRARMDVSQHTGREASGVAGSVQDGDPAARTQTSHWVHFT